MYGFAGKPPVRVWRCSPENDIHPTQLLLAADGSKTKVAAVLKTIRPDVTEQFVTDVLDAIGPDSASLHRLVDMLIFYEYDADGQLSYVNAVDEKLLAEIKKHHHDAEAATEKLRRITRLRCRCAV